ncbi:unnamed protein product [Tuber aestivum]|uniref:Uncharacterized protein n=1 Tax=Tuber aestivum TaxID=59557 RepID=A0A292Q729_9PEZI|nr:unnamed protein product [Tuber aestivum]
MGPRQRGMAIPYIFEPIDSYSVNHYNTLPSAVPTDCEQKISLALKTNLITMTDVWSDDQSTSHRSSIFQVLHGISSGDSVIASGINSASVAHSDAPNLMGLSTAFTNLCAHLPQSNKLKFTSPSTLARQMATRIRRCLRFERGCYVHVSGVAKVKIDEIDDAFQDLGIRGCVRFTYEHDLEAMIIRCMPSEVHERASWSFMTKLAFKIAAIPGHSEDSILPVGSTRFPVPGKRLMGGSNQRIPEQMETNGHLLSSKLVCRKPCYPSVRTLVGG